MGLRAWRFITLLLAALALTMESAHVLELPQKMQYDAQMYSAVNTTLYRYFAIVGGVYQVDSIVAAAVLTFLVHKRRPSFGWTLAGALCLLLAFGIWLAVVAPVHGDAWQKPARNSCCGRWSSTSVSHSVLGSTSPGSSFRSGSVARRNPGTIGTLLLRVKPTPG